MPVLTCDILIENLHKDALFEWLGNLQNHIPFLAHAFDSVVQNPESFMLAISTPIKTYYLEYALDKKDDEYSGKRIRIKTMGKRGSGQMNFSLRTMKPSRNTMLTITWDYSPGSVLGFLLNKAFFEDIYMKAIQDIVQHIQQNKDSIPTPD